MDLVTPGDREPVQPPSIDNVFIKTAKTTHLGLIVNDRSGNRFISFKEKDVKFTAKLPQR